MRHTTNAAIAATFVTVLVAGSVLGLAAPAQAHNYLVASNPTAGSTLTELPAQFSVTTNDTLPNLAGNGSGFGLEIIDSSGLYYGDGCVTVKGPAIYSDAAIGAPGTYRLVWQVISTDGHPVSNEFTFQWAPTGDFTASVGSKTPGDCNGLYSRSGAGATSAPQVNSTPIALIDVIWIGGTVLAVGIAIAAGLFMFRPRAGRED
jgi:methionine-rich copper-binding protein CopC